MDSIMSNRRALRWAFMAGAGLMVLAVLTAVFLAGGGETDAGADPMLSLAPPGIVAEADVPPPIAELYRGAHTHADVFAATPCYCGCEVMLGHRHLLDCFERPEGSGWEAHALGCGVCLGEAQQLLDLLAVGTPADEAVQAVIDEWSDPYLTEE